MLFLGHLVLGLILGFIVYEYLHDRNCIIYCALGSVLPDIVDKPLGHLVLVSTLDNGKIFFHSLVIFLIFCLTGYLVLKYYHSASFLCVAAGILLHQLVDVMWNRPVNWFYPLLGPYQNEVHPDYIGLVVQSELSSVTEWIFLLALLVIGILFVTNHLEHRASPELDPLVSRPDNPLYPGLLGIGIFVLALSLFIIYIWQPVYGL